MTFATLVEQAASLAFKMLHETNKDVLRAYAAQLRWIDAQIEAVKGESHV